MLSPRAAEHQGKLSSGRFEAKNMSLFVLVCCHRMRFLDSKVLLRFTIFLKTGICGRILRSHLCTECSSESLGGKGCCRPALTQLLWHPALASPSWDTGLGSLCLLLTDCWAGQEKGAGCLQVTSNLNY